MKKITIIAGALILAFSFSPLAVAAEDPVPSPPPARAKAPKGCKAKEASLQWKLAAAREQGRHDRIQGLETALRNVRLWCSDNDLKAKAEVDLWEKRQEVEEREQDLREARAGGKPEKIAKREQKLEKARKELQEAETAARQ